LSFRIERSHVIFKHLIHVGPEVDAEAVADLASLRDYTKQTRQIPTPKGPLKEYLFRPKTAPQSLIVFSRKGFVIDAQPSDNVLPLFRDAYDFYEKVMGDTALTATILMDIAANFEVFSPHSVKDFLTAPYTADLSKVQFAGRKLRSNGIILASGTGKFPEEFIQIIIQPLPKDPERRLAISLIYRSVELDDALTFIEKIEKNLTKTLESLAKI